MRIDYTFRHLESTEAIKSYASDKLGKLQKYVRAPAEATVRFSLERHLHCVDVHLSVEGEVYQARGEEEDMYASIDLAVGRIQGQLTRTKQQSVDKRRRAVPTGEATIPPGEAANDE
jgi:putative sigma-54 modulation protein